LFKKFPSETGLRGFGFNGIPINGDSTHDGLGRLREHNQSDGGQRSEQYEREFFSGEHGMGCSLDVLFKHEVETTTWTKLCWLKKTGPRYLAALSSLKILANRYLSDSPV
jgi:hypothetical protein